MTRNEAKDLIVKTIEAMQGMKATELAAMPEVVLPLSLVQLELPDLIDELVEEGRLTEVEYSVPELHWRAKSFLLPANSQVRLLGKQFEYDFPPDRTEPLFE